MVQAWCYRLKKLSNQTRLSGGASPSPTNYLLFHLQYETQQKNQPVGECLGAPVFLLNNSLSESKSECLSASRLPSIRSFGVITFNLLSESFWEGVRGNPFLKKGSPEITRIFTYKP